MKEMLKNIISDAELKGAKVEVKSDTIVQIVYDNGKIERFTEEDGALKTETMLTNSKGSIYYSEFRKDVDLNEFGVEEPRDLLEEFETDAHFYGDDGTEISDVESLEKKWKEIQSMSDEEVQSIYLTSKDSIRRFIDESINTIRTREEKERQDSESKEFDLDEM